MKALPVNKDSFGFLTHPEIPEWDETTNLEACKQWFAKKGLGCDSIIMDGVLGELWSNGEIDTCEAWNPDLNVEGAFIVSIFDTEDGVVALYAYPLKHDIPEHIITIAEDFGLEAADISKVFSATKETERYCIIEELRDMASSAADNGYHTSAEAIDSAIERIHEGFYCPAHSLGEQA